ncbi:peptidyl-prolyl cis-trans isomerase [bacterium]|nr:peptidyl-prolyl cis-trans isomerase [bacterium]
MRSIFIFSVVLFLAFPLLAQSTSPLVIDGKSYSCEEIKAMFALEYGACPTCGPKPEELSKANIDYIINKWVTQKVIYDSILASGVEKRRSYQAELERFKQELAKKIFQEEILPKRITVTEEEIRSFYEQATWYERPRTIFAAIAYLYDSTAIKKATEELAKVEYKGRKATYEQSQGFDWGSIEIREFAVPEEKQPGYEDPIFNLVKDLPEGKSSSPASLEGEKKIIAKVLKVLPAGKIPLEEVKEEVKRQIIYNKANEWEEKIRREALMKIKLSADYDKIRNCLISE